MKTDICIDRLRNRQGDREANNGWIYARARTDTDTHAGARLYSVCERKRGHSSTWMNPEKQENKDNDNNDDDDDDDDHDYDDDG